MAEFEAWAEFGHRRFVRRVPAAFARSTRQVLRVASAAPAASFGSYGGLLRQSFMALLPQSFASGPGRLKPASSLRAALAAALTPAEEEKSRA